MPVQRLGEHVHDRAVVDLRPDRSGPGDEPEQRDQRAEREPAEQADDQLLVGPGERPRERREHEEHRGQQREQQRSPAAEQAPGGQPGDGRVHRATR
ncbi:hypothetical protein [Geodermatophilus sp. CPCC 205761]|uniref:hypothetical protein n=1 Tax=Geodermatophilus sp. CPCC 205761 TaxID=2936597 RepID=UPI003EEED164